MGQANTLGGVRHRKRTYLILMAVCLTLFALSGTVALAYSSALALILALVALAIPPIAVIIANRADDDPG